MFRNFSILIIDLSLNDLKHKEYTENESGIYKFDIKFNDSYENIDL